MSKEAAEKFVSAWEARDPEVLKALAASPQETLVDAEALAALASGLGFETTASELIDVYASRSAVNRRQIGKEDISIDELSEVAGGDEMQKTSWDGCVETYDPNERCYSSDKCLSTHYYYPAKQGCASTYEDNESCYNSDKCSNHFHFYRG